MLCFFSKKLLPFSANKPLIAPEIFDLSPISLFRYHLWRGIADGIDPSPPLPKKDENATASYLMGSCGLSPESALSVAKRVCMKSSERSDSVLRVLKAYGFSDAHITTIIAKRPKLLNKDADRTLKPKLEFLAGAGFSGDVLADILIANSLLVQVSLDRLVGCVDFFSTTLRSKSDVIQALKYARHFLDSSYRAQYEILQNHNVPDAVIMHSLRVYPVHLTRSIHLLDNAVRTAKELGFHPTCRSFPRAVQVISSLSWNRRIQLLREMGWTDEEIFTMFRSQPDCLALADDNVRKKVKFFEESIGWGPAVLSKCPPLLVTSFEKRIMPRFSVLKHLMSRDLIPPNWTLFMFTMSKQYFSKRYIDKYRDQAPDIVEYYLGNINAHEQNEA